MQIMAENIIKTKSFNFALRIVKLQQFLIFDKKEFVLSKQLLRTALQLVRWLGNLNMQKVN